METRELRSKEEVIRDVEADRKEVNRSLRGTKYAWTDGNPAVRAWNATKCAAIGTKEKVVDKVQETKTRVAMKAMAADFKIRENVYRSIGIAVCAGLLMGFVLRKVRAKKSGC